MDCASIWRISGHSRGAMQGFHASARVGSVACRVRRHLPYLGGGGLDPHGLNMSFLLAHDGGNNPIRLPETGCRSGRRRREPNRTFRRGYRFLQLYVTSARRLGRRDRARGSCASWPSAPPSGLPICYWGPYASGTPPCHRFSRSILSSWSRWSLAHVTR